MNEPVKNLHRTATVIAWQNGQATLHCLPYIACHHCHRRNACQMGELNQSLAGSGAQITIAHPQPLQAGQQVILMLNNKSLLQVACIVYLLPLMGFLSGALFAYYYSQQDSLAIIGAIIGAAIMFCIAKLVARRLARQPVYQPMIQFEE